MDKKILKKKVKIALETFISNDYLLLENDVNEITINHKIAKYLGNLFNDMDVDIEYNRVEDKEKYLSGFKDFLVIKWLKDKKNNGIFYKLFKQKEIYNIDLAKKIKKRLNTGLKISKEDNIYKKGIYPDIIIHKRNTDFNLLAIEVKKSNNFNKDRVLYDIIKLEKYRRGFLQYEYCLFLKINIKSKKCYEFFWI